VDPQQFANSPAGKVMKTLQGHWAFVPHPLPPQLQFGNRDITLLSEAERALGKLVGVGDTLPNPQLLIGPFTGREAVLSSRIEGTQTSVTELFQYEGAQLAVLGAESSEPRSEVREVRNYRVALQYGLERLADLPLSLRLTRELHGILMREVRGREKHPGEFRSEQNWIGPPAAPVGEATYVPPAVPEMHEALDAWERYLHAESDLPLLVQCALMHYQFEAIHPFVDGNGRVGRLLIPLYLAEKGLVSKPLLYLSAYFEANRSDYYGRLLAISQRGEWAEWITFFLRGVAEQAHDAVVRSQRLLGLREAYRDRFLGMRASSLRLRLIDLLFEMPVVSMPLAAARLRVSRVSANRALGDLEAQRVIREVTGHKRNRVFIAEELLRAIEEDA